MKLNKNYVVKHLADEIILVHQDEFNVDFSKIITLNEIGLLIINKLDEGLNVEQIADCIVEEYEVDRPTALGDAKAFVKKLLELGIIDE